ncbi:MAG: type IV pilus biogenesis/stability protein PilW [Pseudomonadales bacterium]
MALSIATKHMINIVFAIFVLVPFLSACVTTQQGGLAARADEKKTLEYSVQLARSYISKGHWAAAKRHLKNALKIDKSSPEVYETLALVFQNTGETELAEENFKRSIKLASDYSRVRNNYAVFLYQQRRYKEAAKQLEVVVSDILYDKRGMAFVNLGRSYLQLEELNKAEAAFSRAYGMDRHNAQLMYQLADVYFQLKEYPKAYRLYRAYRSQVKQQPAQALWLGIRLADKFDNQDEFSSFVLALKNLYPASKEYLEYKSVFGHDG